MESYNQPNSNYSKTFAVDSNSNLFPWNDLSWIRMEWWFVRGKNKIGKILKHFIMKIFFEILHTLQVVAPGPPAQTIPSVMYPGKISLQSSWEWIGIWIHCKWFGRIGSMPWSWPHPIWEKQKISSPETGYYSIHWIQNFYFLNSYFTNFTKVLLQQY